MTSIIEERVKQLETIPLKQGSHDADAAGAEMCAMEVVAWISGEPHSDHPRCASPVIAAFMRAWNDGLRSDAERDRLLKPFLVRLVGSRGTPEQERDRSLMALEWHNGVMLPAFLDLVDELRPHAKAVRADPLNPVAIDAARVAAWDAARDAAWDAVRDAAWDAVRVAAGGAAGVAARVAARDAARVAAGGAARDAAWDASGDALTETVTTLQASAQDLLDRMLQVTENAS